MVFVPDPYFNEPGYERDAKTPHGKQKSASYNHDLRLQTAKHAILGGLRHPDPVFKEALWVHYGFRGPAVLGMLQKWVQEGGSEKAQLQEQVEQITVELSKLPKSGAAARADPSLQNGREGIPAIVEQQHRPTKRRRESSEIVVEQGVVIDLT
eukprot:GHUV01033525.1.p1 GENE.GHUV01033525.1~~GHUV01033525.1.p1  ORF type:complete len:153 (+),score=26.09 GHUV01033525.1:246-704(+)